MNTPTTDEVLMAYANRLVDESGETDPGLRLALAAEYHSAAQEWLRERDRAVVAEAIEEATQEWGEGAWEEAFIQDGVNDDWSAVRTTVEWLRSWAKRGVRR